MKKSLLLLLVISVCSLASYGQDEGVDIMKASYYHNKFNGKRTATGDTYSHQLLTAASNMYKLGTRLLVTNVNTGKSVIVTVNDRMAARLKNRVDLSQSAFQQIASLGAGIVNVVVKVVTGKTEPLPGL